MLNNIESDEVNNTPSHAVTPDVAGVVYGLNISLWKFGVQSYHNIMHNTIYACV